MASPVAASANVDSSGASGLSCTVTKPTGLAAGDLMVAFFFTFHSGTITADTPPAGWTTELTRTETDGAEQHRNGIYWKIADSTDAAATNFTFARTGGTGFARWCSVVRVTGAASAAVVDVSSFNTTADTLTTITFPSVTTTGVDRLLMTGGCSFALGVNSGASWAATAQTGFAMVSGSTVNSSIYGGVSTKAQSASGASGTSTDPYSSGVDTFFIGITVAIKPVAAAAAGMTFPSTPPFIANLLR